MNTDTGPDKNNTACPLRFDIGGMHCAACSSRIERVTKRLPGMSEATVNLGDLRADVESSLGKIDALITELNRKWPFAPKEQKVTLP